MARVLETKFGEVIVYRDRPELYTQLALAKSLGSVPKNGFWEATVRIYDQDTTLFEKFHQCPELLFILEHYDRPTIEIPIVEVPVPVPTVPEPPSIWGGLMGVLFFTALLWRKQTLLEKRHADS